MTRGDLLFGKGDSARVVELTVAVRMETERAAARHFSRNMEGACYVASHALASLLRADGFAADLVHGSYRTNRAKTDDHNCHCWVETDGLIIDLTASQFGVRSEIHIPRSRYARSRYRAEDLNQQVVKLWSEVHPGDVRLAHQVRRAALKRVA